MPLSAEDLATEIIEGLEQDPAIPFVRDDMSRRIWEVVAAKLIEHVTQNGTVTEITVDPNTGAQINPGSIG